MGTPRHNISWLQLMFVVTVCVGSVNSQGLYTVMSDLLIVTDDGFTVGPCLSLSATVLQDGAVLRYKCIEKGDGTSNSLAVCTGGGTVDIVEESLHVGGKINREPCRAGDSSNCTVTTGSIVWRRSMGNKYCCSAYPEKSYYIHWINPAGISTSGDRDLPSRYYGNTVMVKCGVDITPTDISYDGLLDIKWQFTGSATGSALRHIAESDTVSWALTSQGANSTLTITNFNPIKHGGEYQCIGEMLRYSGEQLVSPTFKIWSQPSAKLINNKRREFNFGKYESNVKFTCEALSYPFPERIEFKLQAAIINELTKGVGNYRKYLVSVNVERHTATFTVSNMSDVFQNDSVIECEVVRRDNRVAISQKRVILVEDISTANFTSPLPVMPGISVPAAPMAKLRNDKRRTFTFLQYESNVRFTCQAVSYPSLQRIEFRLDGSVVNEDTIGVSHYEMDTTSLDDFYHQATFTVTNMSEVFHSGSKLECWLFGKDGSSHSSQQTVILVGSIDNSSSNSSSSTTSRAPETGMLKPWIVAVIVIIPVLILLVVIVLLMWKCRNYYNGDRGDYRIGRTDDDDDDD